MCLDECAPPLDRKYNEEVLARNGGLLTCPGWLSGSALRTAYAPTNNALRLTRM